MYRGTNPTALQSQKWLADSLIALMQEQPYSQITIQMICKRADLSRQTFYNFFSTKEEILRFCLQTQYEKHFERLRARSSLSLQETVEAFVCVLEENRVLLMVMIDNRLESIIADEIAKCVSLFASQFVNEKNNNEFLPYSEALLSGALAYLLLYWFRQENPLSSEQLTKLLSAFLEGKLYTFE